jgi:hypothetical protein
MLEIIGLQLFYLGQVRGAILSEQLESRSSRTGAEATILHGSGKKATLSEL